MGWNPSKRKGKGKEDTSKWGGTRGPHVHWAVEHLRDRETGRGGKESKKLQVKKAIRSQVKRDGHRKRGATLARRPKGRQRSKKNVVV